MSEQASRQPAAEPWSGLWRRVAAFAADGLLVGLLGFAIGAAGFNLFAHMGNWARLVGLVVAGLYFGLSALPMARGQTPGQRLVKLEVRRLDGGFLTPRSAMSRAFVLTVPLVVNGISFGATATPSTLVAGVLAGTLLFGMIAVQLYLLLFNRPSRRLLHDLLFGAVVLRQGAQPDPAPLSAGRLRIAAGLAVAVFVLTAGGTAYFAARPPAMLVPMLRTAKAVEAQPEVMQASVVTQTQVMKWASGPATRTRTLIVAAQLRDWPRDPGREAVRIARIAADTYPFVRGQGLTVSLRYGYDIGIARGSNSYNVNFPSPAGS